MANSAEYEYIVMHWDGSSATGKTGVWSVMARKHPGMILGRISWYGRWRQYTFFPAEGSIYSAGCLEDVAQFIKLLHDGRRRDGKATDWKDEAKVCSIPDCGCTGYEHP